MLMVVPLVCCRAKAALQILVPTFQLSINCSKFEVGFVHNGFFFSLIRNSLSRPFNTQIGTLTVEIDDKRKKLVSFTKSYLVNKFGFTQEVAESVSKKITIKNPQKADAVVSLLSEYGFSNAQINKLISSRPSLLSLDPNKILLPKFEFLCSIGFSRSDFGQIDPGNISLLTSSLEHRIIPCYNFFKTLHLSNDRVIHALKRLFRYGVYNFNNGVGANVSVLRDLCVDQSVISSFVIQDPKLMFRNSAKFRDIVDKAIEMGFQPRKGAIFVQALRMIHQLAPATWEQKIGFYKIWGLSDDEIWSAIRKFPYFILHSREKIMVTMDLFVNKMGWPPAYVAMNPVILGYSLEKRIVPRCSVVRILQLKQLVESDISFSFLKSSEKIFLKKFVSKYLKEIPQLLSIYQGKTNIVELGFGFEEKSLAVS